MSMLGRLALANLMPKRRVERLYSTFSLKPNIKLKFVAANWKMEKKIVLLVIFGKVFVISI